MEKHKIFKKWFLRFKNSEIERSYLEQRSMISYTKYIKFNLVISIATSFSLLILYLSGSLKDEYSNKESKCKIKGHYYYAFCVPILIAIFQLETICMKCCKNYHNILGSITVIFIFIGFTESELYRYKNIDNIVVGFGSTGGTLMTAIYIGKEIMKYWERASIVSFIGLSYFFIRNVTSRKGELYYIPMGYILLALMIFLFYNFEKSQRNQFYLLRLITEKEREWSKLFGKMLVGLIIRGRDKEIKYSNQIAQSLVNEDYNINEVNMRGMKNLVEDIDLEWKSGKKESDKIDLELSRNNEIKYLEINRMNLELGGERCKIYILKDMTLARRIQLEITKNAEEKDLFFASMSHELRNPLNVLLGTIDIFKKSKFKYDTEIIQTAETCGETLLNIIGNILDVSKIENKKLEIDPIGGNLVEGVLKVVLMMKTLAEKKGLYLDFLPAVDIYNYYSFDHTRLNQVLINLIGNAIKFTDKGGIKILLNWFPQQNYIFTNSSQYLPILEQIHQTDYETLIESVVYDASNISELVDDRNEIISSLITHNKLSKENTRSQYVIEESKETLKNLQEKESMSEEEIKEEKLEKIASEYGSEKNNKGFMKIQIIDTGVGISEQDIKILFQPFSQAKHTQKKFGGTGLGLWISHNIIQIMGGSLKVVSEKKLGSSFVIVLPLEKYEYSEKLNCHPSLINTFQPSRILLVEEDLSNRKIMGELLERNGSSVFVANNGQTALETFKERCKSNRDNPYFTAILTEMSIQVLSGQNLIMSIRKYERKRNFRDTPIIVISGNPTENEKVKCMDVLGANYFLSKPVTLHMIQKVLFKICGRTEKRMEMMIEEEKETNIQILVVDDDIFCAQIFIKQLIQNNFANCHAVYSGLEAISHFEKQMLLNKDYLTIIYLDSHLQDTTGPLLARQLITISMENHHNIQIYSMSGDSIKSQKEFYAKSNLNPHGFFQKPIDFSILCRKLRNIPINT